MAHKFAAELGDVRQFVVQAAADRRPHLAKAIQSEFGVSRATAHNYLSRFLQDGIILRTALGQYELAHKDYQFFHPVRDLEEHKVWVDEIAPVLTDLPSNVIEIWHYGCTEMINNVIDHSGSENVLINVDRSTVSTQISVHDSGVGIFRKIAKALNLEDDRHAVLELSKGKVTTDPANHTGEGIFFSSRVFDLFRILSGGVYFQHERDADEDWILADEPLPEHGDGTAVYMTLNDDSKRTLRGVFDEYATDTVDYRFDRTVVPVKLLQYGDDRLISRSQAKRLMNRFDRFRVVVLDFQDVETIGQAFADEVFRVFQSQHPEIELIPINANEQVARMTTRSLAEQRSQRDLFGNGG
jgi:anti-sigma regulatory factor (Ser/Thr protein kinase)